MAGAIFWLLIAVFGFLFIGGLISRSWKFFLMSGMAITLPSLYFLGAENGFRLLALMPLLPFGLSYAFKRQQMEGSK